MISRVPWDNQEPDAVHGRRARRRGPRGVSLGTSRSSRLSLQGNSLAVPISEVPSFTFIRYGSNLLISGCLVICKLLSWEFYTSVQETTFSLTKSPGMTSLFKGDLVDIKRITVSEHNSAGKHLPLHNDPMLLDLHVENTGFLIC